MPPFAPVASETSPAQLAVHIASSNYHKSACVHVCLRQWCETEMQRTACLSNEKSTSGLRLGSPSAFHLCAEGGTAFGWVGICPGLEQCEMNARASPHNKELATTHTHTHTNTQNHPDDSKTHAKGSAPEQRRHFTASTHLHNSCPPPKRRPLYTTVRFGIRVLR